MEAESAEPEQKPNRREEKQKTKRNLRGILGLNIVLGGKGWISEMNPCNMLQKTNFSFGTGWQTGMCLQGEPIYMYSKKNYMYSKKSKQNMEDATDIPSTPKKRLGQCSRTQGKPGRRTEDTIKMLEDAWKT